MIRKNRSLNGKKILGLKEFLKKEKEASFNPTHVEDQIIELFKI